MKIVEKSELPKNHTRLKITSFIKISKGHKIKLSVSHPGFAFKILEYLIIKDDVCLCVNRGQMKNINIFVFKLRIMYLRIIEADYY